MLKLSDLADKIAPHLIGVSTPFGGALAKNYIGANIADSDDTLPTGEDLDKVKADTQAEIDKVNAGVDKANAGVDKANAGVDSANAGIVQINQQITNLKNEMENVGVKVMSHIPDLANGQDLDPSTIKDPRTAITSFMSQIRSNDSSSYISLDTPVTQASPLMLSGNPSNCQIQIKIEVHDYPAGAIPWYYFHFIPYAKITAIRVKLGDTIVNSFTQGGNMITGVVHEGMEIAFDSQIAYINAYSWGNPVGVIRTPPSSLGASHPSKVDYIDPRDGTNYNDTPAVMVIIPYGDWDAKNNNGSWSIKQGSTPGGLYIAVYKGKCICYDLAGSNVPSLSNQWRKRYFKYASHYGIDTFGLNVDYIGPNGQETISYK